MQPLQMSTLSNFYRLNPKMAHKTLLKKCQKNINLASQFYKVTDFTEYDILPLPM